MSAPNEVGAALLEIKARTGWTWGELAGHLGTTPTYARKLATSSDPKFTGAGAGSSLRGNVSKFQSTGRAQAPVQRAQRVRAPGGTTRQAEPRTAAPRGKYGTTRRVFAGPSRRDGWAVEVKMPASEGVGRERGRAAIMDAVRRAAQGGRRVSFVVRGKDGVPHELGARGGYAAGAALAGMRREGNDPLEWLGAEFDGRYGTDAAGLVSVEVVALP